MELLLNFIYNRAQRFQAQKILGLGVAFALAILASGLIVSSSLLITEIEFMGVLLGSLGGVVLFFTSFFLYSIFNSLESLNRFKEKFSISLRRKSSIVLGLVSLILIALAGGGAGNNPLIGATTVLTLGWIVTFLITTPGELEAIENARDEILWAYENQDTDTEANFDDSELYEEEEEYSVGENENFSYGKEDMESYFKSLENRREEN